EIDRLSVSEEPGSWGQSIEEAIGLLAGAPQFQQKEVYLLSDFQQTNWKSTTDNAANSLHSLCQKLSEQAEVVCIDAGPEQSRVSNLAITECRPQDELVTTEQPVRWTVTVKNWGETPAEAVPVDFYINGRLTDSKNLQLAAGGEAAAEFQHQFAKAGPNIVEARLGDDALSADNRRWRIVDCRDELPVLLVNGKISGERKQQATYFAELALAPRFGETGTPVRDWIQPHVIRDGELTATDLSRYACIIVCNVATMTAREADILEQYVASGRGLILAVGDQVLPEAYNDILYRDGKGILPAKLGDRQGELGDSPTQFAFDPIAYEHPLLKVFAGNPDAGLETSRVSMYYQLAAPLPASLRIALKYDTGDPAIVESRRGSGKVLLVTTSLDRSWGTWVLWPSFPPLMNELVKYAVTGNDDQRHLTAGEPFIWPMLQLGATAHDLSLQRPDGVGETLTPQQANATSNAAASPPAEEPKPVDDGAPAISIVYEKTDKIGVYELRGASTDQNPVYFAVHPPAAESDLTYLDQRTLEKEIFADLPIKFQTDFQPLSRTFNTISAPPAALPKLLLWIVLLCLIAEPVLAWRFQHGVILLLFFVIAGAWLVVWKTNSISDWLALLLGLLILAAIAAYLSQTTSARRFLTQLRERRR
ncbi:MAG: CARDB domain-containing protein, partial [Planctomycetaceae bacterium]